MDIKYLLSYETEHRGRHVFWFSVVSIRLFRTHTHTHIFLVKILKYIFNVIMICYSIFSIV